MSDNDGLNGSNGNGDNGLNSEVQQQNHYYGSLDSTDWQELARQRNQIILEYGQTIVQLAVDWTNHDRQLRLVKAAAEDKDRAISELRNSASWKLTKPLRFLSSFFKRGASNGRQPSDALQGLVSATDGDKQVSLADSGFTKRDDNRSFIHQDENPSYQAAYDCDYQDDMDFSAYDSRIKPIAFYLPQFHAIPENDRWWGEGFTEWVNTSKAEPRFKGHYQPRQPHDDFGYYNLTNLDAIKRQVELARGHGIYGFCYYLYWFSGKRLLEQPLDILIRHPEIDIKFCLCWANENWTRNWDGQENELLIEQLYRPDDPAQLVDDVKKYFGDERYIRVDGKPVILIYNRGRIPNLVDFIFALREQARKNGIGEIQIWLCRTFGMEGGLYRPLIDAEVEFPPHNAILADNYYMDGNPRKGIIHSYPELVNKKIDDMRRYWPDVVIPCYFTVMMAWDNTARKQDGWVVYDRFSLRDYYLWVRETVEYAERNEQEFFFVNAWNEWAEGTYLEPDKRYGYAVINTLSKALYKLPFSGSDTQ